MAISKQQAQAILEANGGEIPAGTSEADAEHIAEAVGSFSILTRFLKRAAAALTEEVEIRLSRSGNAISIYRGGKHAVSFTPNNLKLVLAQTEALKTFLATDQAAYYLAVPEYTYRGKKQDGKPAAVVTMKAGSYPQLVASGDKADALAKERGLKPLNQVSEESAS